MFSVFFLFFLTTTGTVNAQRNTGKIIDFIQISTDEDLANAAVWAVAQDSLGFIWIGTSYGLNRYNGHEMLHYFHEPGDTASLAGNEVRRLHVSKDGDVWVNTMNGGVSRYDQEKGYFEQYPELFSKASTVKQRRNNFFFEDSQGKLFVGTTRGLFYYQSSKDHFIQLSFEDGSMAGEAFQVAEIGKGNLWVATERGLYRLQPKDSAFILEHSDAHRSVLEQPIRGLLADNERGLLWAGTKNRTLLKFSYNQGKVKLDSVYALPEEVADKTIRKIFLRGKDELWLWCNRDKLIQYEIKEGGCLTFKKLWQYHPDKLKGISHPIVYATLVDSEGGLWIGTDGGGLNYLPPSSNKLLYYQDDDYFENSLSANSVLTIFEDRQKGLWFGTFGGGVSHLDFGNKGFEHFKLMPENVFGPGGLQNPLVLDFFEKPDGNIWVATNGGGLHLLNPKTNFFTTYKHDPLNPYSIPNDKLAAVIEDREGQVWVGASGNGLSRFDPQTKRFYDYTTAEGVSSTFVFSLFQDDEGRIWAGGNRGLDIYNAETDRFESFFEFFPNISQMFDIQGIWSIKQEQEGTIWIGAEGVGLIKFNPRNSQLKQYLFKENENSISSNEVWFLLNGENDKLWIGSSNGLNLFNKKTEEFRYFNVKDGLPNNSVLAVLQDDNNHLWLATGDGLCLFDIEKEQVINNFYKVDGLQENEFFPAGLKASDGYLYFGGINGFNRFKPEQVTDKNTFIPPTVITKLFVDNQEIKPGDSTGILKNTIHHSDSVKLHYSDRVLTLEFAALNFRSPQRNQYKYRLQPDEKAWNDAGTDGKAVYTNLDPGKYIFEVKGSNNDGIWNEKPTQLFIHIPPPWWETWWAQLLFALLLFSIVGIVIWKRFALVQQQKRVLEEKVLERIREIANQNEEIKSQQQHILSKNRELENSNQQLKELIRQRDGMVNMVTHDLRSPLNRLKGLLQILQIDEKSSKSAQADIFHMGFRVIQDGNQLINDLLDLYGFENEKKELSIAYFRVDESINYIIKTYSKQLEAKKLNLHLEMEKVEMESDRMAFERIADNLLSNAVKFTSPEKNVVVRLEQNNDIVKLQVQDSGPGFTDEDKKHLYKMFSRLSAKPTQGESSTGLGLAIVKALAQRLSGQITMETQLNEGTTFTIEFPVKWEQPAKK